MLEHESHHFSSILNIFFSKERGFWTTHFLNDVILFIELWLSVVSHFSCVRVSWEYFLPDELLGSLNGFGACL